MVVLCYTGGVHKKLTIGSETKLRYESVFSKKRARLITRLTFVD